MNQEYVARTTHHCMVRIHGSYYTVVHIEVIRLMVNTGLLRKDSFSSAWGQTACSLLA